MALTKEQEIVLKFYRLLGAKWLTTSEYGEECFCERKPDKELADYGCGTWVLGGRCWSNLMQSCNDKKKLGLSSWEGGPVNISQLLGLFDISEWKKLPIDSKVEVYVEHKNKWVKRYYAGIINGMPCCFPDGATSWTAAGNEEIVDIDNIRIYKE